MPAGAGPAGRAGPDVKAQIRRFLTSRAGTHRLSGLADGDSLLQAGVVDSLVMVELLAHIEKAYGIAVADEELTPENFDSVDSIASFVSSKLDRT